MNESWAQWILGGLFAVIAAVFGDMFRRLFNRQDELEKSKAEDEFVKDRFEDMQQMIREHMHEDRDMHRQVGQKLDAVVQQIGITNATLANLAGKVDGHLVK